MKYQEWFLLYLEHYVKPSSKYRTYNHYNYLFNSHIKEKIGDRDMNSISSIELQSLVSEWLMHGNRKTKGGLSKSTVNTLITLLQSSYKCAYLMNEASIDPTANLKRPKNNASRITSFNLSEQRLIENAALHHKKQKMLGVIICLYTGIRIGELLALTWDDIDLCGKLMYINKTAADDKQKDKENIINPPKTISSERIIPLPDKIIYILNEIKKSGDTKHVISENGHSVLIRSYQKTFAKMLKDINVEHKGFHSLRHTFATRAIECGMDVKTLSEILGHKNTSITLNLYVHSLSEHKIEMMNKLANFL